ncbi:UNVERIFIED_CONTAM: hypothetical protein GTU68_064982 [Idotea baltica]|nr:hypothetical protein [Idotea baltica]
MQHVPVLVPQLVLKLVAVAKNPTKPHYIHFLFESLSLVIKVVCQSIDSAVQEFDRNLFPIFQEILQNEVDSLIPYVFQILSLLLERQKASIPEPYMQLLPFLVLPALWERPGYVGPMVRLLQSFIEKSHAAIIQMGKLEAILGVFNKLNASKSNDHEGFYLLQTMILHIPKEALEGYWNRIFLLMFKRLSSSKTSKYIKCLLVFFSLFTCQHSVAKLVSLVDSLQANMFGMVIERLIVPELQKVSGDTERKLCAVGVTNILSDSDIYAGKYSAMWPNIVQATISLLEFPADNSHPAGEHFVDVESVSMFQGSSSRLVNASKSLEDPLLGKVDNPKAYFVQKIVQLSQIHPGTMQSKLTQMTQETQSQLMAYLQQSGTSLA